ncbi:tRNA synthetases class I (M)-domain-containing protein [Lanmaoa asiatica]|nr:tRNA synthetases class I (M)-domain-containing protein [Lanmaoa asiatica]
MFSCKSLRLRIRNPSFAFSRPAAKSLVAPVWRHNATRSTDKPFYVTTPIFYPNAHPHIGHLHSLVTADIIVRFQRILNPVRPVVFLTGTDEHGLKMQQAAEAKGVAPLEWCDIISAEFRRLAERANISGTMFMRTTQRQHRDTVEHVWRVLADQGLVYKDTYEGYYSTTDECFYPSSRVTSHPTRPNTKISTETGSVVEWSSEVNYKFRLSKFREVLLTHYSTAAELNAKVEDGVASRGVHPDVYQHAIIQDLKTDSLEDLSISRPRDRIRWGIPVPGDPSQTVYVWFDALLVYLSGVGYPSAGTTAWPPDVQVVGKDIVRFHAVYLPAILQAMKLPMPKTLLAHAHWTAGQKKMSKSLGNVADPIAAMDDFGVDAVRFYLARIGGRFRDDVDWSEEQLRKHADEIRNLLGNYFLRITSSAIKNRVVAAATALSEPLVFRNLFSRQFFNLDFSGASTSLLDLETCKLSTNEELLALLDDLGTRVSRSMRNLEVADALHAIVLILRQANAVLTALEPWSNVHPPDVALSCYLTALETLRITGILLQPFVPHTSEKLLDGLNIPADERSVDYARVGKGEVGRGLVMEVKGIKLFEQPTKKGSSGS